MALLVAPRTCCCCCLFTYLIWYVTHHPPSSPSFTCVLVRNKVRTWWEQQKSNTSTPPSPPPKLKYWVFWMQFFIDCEEFLFPTVFITSVGWLFEFLKIKTRSGGSSNNCRIKRTQHWFRFFETKKEFFFCRIKEETATGSSYFKNLKEPTVFMKKHQQRTKNQE